MNQSAGSRSVTDNRYEIATSDAPLNVVHYVRKPGAGNYSLERMFEDVRAHGTQAFHYTLRINKFESKGLLTRVADILLAPWYQGNINHVTGDVHFLTYFLRRKRTVLTIHDCASLERLTGARRLVLWLLWYWLPLRRVAHVTVNSEFTKKQLAKYVQTADDRISVIYPSLSPEFRAYPKALNLTRPRILHVGTAPNKNLDRVVEAVSALSCVLVTIGTLNPRQIETLQGSGLEWMNYSNLSRGEIVEQYTLADIVMFPSTYEGFGYPITEANAIGRPVITSNITSMPEVAGSAACYVDPYDVRSIREGVNRVCTDAAYCAALIQSGLRNAERFNVRVVATQYEKVYARIAEAEA